MSQGDNVQECSQQNIVFFFGNVFLSEPLDGLVLLILPVKALKVQGSLPERKPQCCEPSWDGKSIAFS